MDNILGLGQFLCKKPFVIFYIRRLGIAAFAPGDMCQKLIGRQLQIVQEPAFLRTDIIGTYGNAEFPDQGFREIADAVRGND